MRVASVSQRNGQPFLKGACSHEPFKFFSGTAAGTVVTSVVSGDKMMTVVGHQFITLTVYICVLYGGREARVARNCQRQMTNYTPIVH